MPTHEQIVAAAQWWTDRLTDCRNSGLSATERREPENTAYQFAEVLMDLGRPHVTAEQVDAFRLALMNGIAHASPYEQRQLHVDYDCDRVLSEALAVAGIPERTGMLPIKTDMWLNEDGTVAVRYGYGANVQMIYAPVKPADAGDPIAASDPDAHIKPRHRDPGDHEVTQQEAARPADLRELRRRADNLLAGQHEGLARWTEVEQIEAGDVIEALLAALARRDKLQPVVHTDANRERPIPMLNTEQEQAAKVWAADDRLWTTRKTVEFNLLIFAHVVLKHSQAEASLATLVALVAQRVEEDAPRPDSEYCWHCQANVNGTHAPVEPHTRECWWKRAADALRTPRQE